MAALLIGCASMPKTQVQSLPDTSDALPPGHALVVFARPSSNGPAQPFFIVDSNGRLVGELPAQSRLHVVVPAGQQTFVGWHHAVLGDYGQSTLVTGEVLAGRAYLITIGGGEYPMQFLSMPLAIPNCGLIDEVIQARRVGLDPSAGPGVFKAGKVAEQIADAQERYRDRQGQNRYFWNFHTQGGTHEMFFTNRGGAPLSSIFGKHGGGALCQSARGKLQAEVDLAAWAAYFEEVLDVEFEWKTKDD